MHRALAFLAIALASITSVSTAAAEPARAPNLYVRVGLGGGVSVATLDTAVDSASTGASVATELSVGFTPRPRLVFGLGTFPMVVPSPSYDGVSAGGQHVSGTGPFVDYFFGARGGLHARVGILFAAGYLDGSGARAGQVGFGYGATAGVGYDHRVARRWSLGAIARVTAYRLFGVDDRFRAVAPALLATATFH